MRFESDQNEHRHPEAPPSCFVRQESNRAEGPLASWRCNPILKSTSALETHAPASPAETRPLFRQEARGPSPLVKTEATETAWPRLRMTAFPIPYSLFPIPYSLVPSPCRSVPLIH